MRFFDRLFRWQHTTQLIDFGLLNTDVHSHLIPGIDDGAKTMEDSIGLIKRFIALGYKKVITTPHIMSDLYPNSEEDILAGLEKLKAEVKSQNLEIEIEAAAEYLVDHDFEKSIGKKDLLTFGNRYILIELSFVEAPANLDRVIFELQLEGYKPVLAHAERYPYYHDNLEKLRALHNKGVILQLNINSLTGHYSLDVMQCAERLIRQKLIRLVGSDCHHMGHLDMMESAQNNSALASLIQEGNLLNTQL